MQLSQLLELAMPVGVREFQIQVYMTPEVSTEYQIVSQSMSVDATGTIVTFEAEVIDLAATPTEVTLTGKACVPYGFLKNPDAIGLGVEAPQV